MAGSPVLERGAFAIGWVLAIFTAACPATPFAATAEQAQALSERAAAYILVAGERKAFVDFTRREGGFVDGELFVFCYDRIGVTLANGGNPAFVGRNLLHLKDTDGREPVALGVKMGFEQGRGWIDFKWPNPTTKKIERTSAYMIRTHEVACGVGYYKG
jgi:cytochrome c